MKMNKKGGIMTFITNTLVYAIIILIVFLIVGGTGGFKTLAGVGAVLAKIPPWFIVAVGFLYLLNAMRGK